MWWQSRFGRNSPWCRRAKTFEEIGIVLNKDELKSLSMNTNEKPDFTVYYVRKNVDVNEGKLQEEKIEELKYFKI